MLGNAEDVADGVISDMVVLCPLLDGKGVHFLEDRLDLLQQRDESLAGILALHGRVALEIGLALKTDLGVDCAQPFLEIFSVLHM